MSQKPNVTMAGVPDGIKLTFTDELFGLTNYIRQANDGNTVTGAEISIIRQWPT